MDVRLPEVAVIAAVGIAAAALIAPVPLTIRMAAAGIALATVVGPMVSLLLGGLVVGSLAVRRIHRRRRAAESDADGVLLAIDLVVLGVAGGLSFPQSVGVAASGVTGGTQHHLLAMQRRLATGSPTAASGPFADVARIAERSAASGAPMRPALQALAESVRRDRAADQRARLARLPVRLLFPLALLILPGFVLLAVGPTVISGFSRLSL